MVNMDAWNGLDEATQNVISGCAAMAEYAGDWRSIQYNEFTVNELGKNGMTTGPVSEEMAAELRAIGETMTAEWLETAGEGGKAIVDASRRRNSKPAR